MPKLQFYLLDLRRAEINNRQAVLLFGRTLDNNRICIIDLSFLPYFYVVPKKGMNVQEKLEKLEVERENIISKVVKTELLKKKFYGREIDAIKVYVPFQRDINIIKSIIDEWEIIEGIYESDISYLRRYLTEKGIIISTLLEADADPFNAGFKLDTFLAKSITTNTEDSIKSPKILAFDIETYNPEGRKIDMKNNPIIMISFYSEGFKKVFTWKRFKTDLEYVEFVNSEADLIGKFFQTVGNFQPDVITGYNTDIFDFPYIEERAKKYKLNAKIGLDNAGIRLVKGDNARARIPGIVHIDNYRFIRKAIAMEGGYSLDNVATKLLGRGKKKINIEDLYKIWDQGNEMIEPYCEYNLVDSEIAYELCRKFLPEIIELTKITGLSMDNITRLGYSQIAESFLIRQANSFNELVPNKPDKTEMARRFLESYKGSFVFEPKPGIYDDIVIFDFRSLYPTIIVSHNISPDTIDCSCCDNDSNIAPDYPKEHHFCSKKKGFLSVILEDLITRRTRIKEIGKDNLILKARAETLKLLANSFYGYLGFYGARWYSIESARVITAWGRYYIKQVIEKAQKEGFIVIYSDTDSIFIALAKKSEKDTLDFLINVNESLHGLMELEFEGFYRRGLFVSAKEKSTGAKKKYALLTREGNLKIRGFESVRTNWPEVVRKVQRTIIEGILKTGDAEDALLYLRNTIEQLRNKEIDNKDTIIETTLQKNIESYDNAAPHVVVARAMKDKGIDISPGMKIEYIVAEGEGRINERAKLPEDIKDGGYDSDYYINNQVIPAIEKIFELFDYKKEDLIETKDQKKLDDFWRL
ncbi:MAG: ribonuclease H-like domain-containing protein [Nanoarchaeota archaeon]|nr:ribonuclease H-like domain-containing protein [Nanoarchaeota archaeon]